MEDAAAYNADAEVYGSDAENAAACGFDSAYSSDTEVYGTDAEEDVVYDSDELDQIVDELEVLKGMCYTLERQFLDDDNNICSGTLLPTPSPSPPRKISNPNTDKWSEF
ncbi:hypothetical protein IWW48_001614 [Coemansia sp. RSA 1200]|nr:hypothetical protein IWW48_001614 [Coemansia sp. RSA 1200]